MAKGYKTGGRQKGTPNKENPLKGFLKTHSIAYFEPRDQMHPLTGRPLTMSDFEMDMLLLTPGERVSAELRLLEFHTPKMKAMDLDIEAKVTSKTIEDMLRDLCNESDED